MKDITIINRQLLHEEGKVVEQIVYFVLKDTNIEGRLSISTDEGLTDEEVKEKIRAEIYGNSNDKDIGTLTATVGLNTTEFEEKVKEAEEQLERLGEKAKSVMDIYPKELIEAGEGIGAQVLANMLMDTIRMLVYKE